MVKRHTCSNCFYCRSGLNKEVGSFNKKKRSCDYTEGPQCHIYPPTASGSPAVRTDWVCCYWTDAETHKQPLKNFGTAPNRTPSEMDGEGREVANV